MSFKAFAQSVLKASLVVFIAAIGLLAIVAGVYYYADSRERESVAALEEVRTFSSDMRDPLGFQLTVKIKLVDGSMRAQLLMELMEGYPEYFEAPANREASFFFDFVDADGFVVLARKASYSELDRRLDKTGRLAALRHTFTEHLSVDAYRRIANVSTRWTFDTAARSVEISELARTPADEPPDEPLPDPCAPNLSKAERLKRLALHGEVRQLFSSMYGAGRLRVQFYDDGRLYSCR